MNMDDVLQQAEAANLQQVRFLYVDNGGIIRGKATHADHLRGRMMGGIGLTPAMQAMNMLDQLQPIPEMGPVGEIRLMPDPDSFRILPYSPRVGVMMCDMISLDHRPWTACPRSFLKRVVDRAAAMGLRVLATYEDEFTLAYPGKSPVPAGRSRILRPCSDSAVAKLATGAIYDSSPPEKSPQTYFSSRSSAPRSGITVNPDDTGEYRPIDDTLCFSSIAMEVGAPVIADIMDALKAQGISPEQYYPELGHGQHELSIAPTCPLTAADNQVRYRETVRAVARQHGMVASFAPKPFADQAGNGAHIHFSLWDAEQKRNLMWDTRDRYNVSAVGYQFAAGVLRHLPGLVALTCASVNSYRRLNPRSWSSAYTAFGPDNREAAVRIASTFWGNEEQSMNMELKASDSSANPYLAIGALIAAGLDGIEHGWLPGESIEVDPAALSDAEREQLKIHRLPADLAGAIDALNSDPFFEAALGELLLRSYSTVKRSEARAFAEQDAAFELKRHFYTF